MSSDQPQRDYDVIVLGGGPAGATAGMLLARAGFKALVLEKSSHPRFHIGESFLPRHFEFLRELGLEQAVLALPHTDKYGAEFIFGYGGKSQRFFFTDSLIPTEGRSINIERSLLDAMLIDQARQAGAEVLENAGVKEILRLADGEVEVSTAQRRYTARFLIDASGQGTVVGKHLGTKRVLAHHRKVAYFGQFSGVERLPGREAGSSSIVMCNEGWFWIIPLSETKTSIGVVMDVDGARQADQPVSEMLQWAIERCPLVRQRTRNATFHEDRHTIADFSYKCRPYAGPGYFMVGDAAAFVDPIFSTGVCLAMLGAREAVRSITAILREGANANRTRRGYIRFVEGSTSYFFRLIHLYYHHSFRELFMSGQGPLQVHKAIIGLLAGYVFPRPDWSLRWRMMFFELCVLTQKFVAIAPPCLHFSLLAPPAPAPAPAGKSM